MVRSAAKKVMWVGRATVFLVGLSVILALLFGVASMTFAKDGNPWLLGRSNVATAITSLGGRLGVDGPMVRITNNNTDTGGDGFDADDTALELRVQQGEPPMWVNSDTTVTNLNADKVDGKDESAFLGKTEKAADSDKLDGQHASAFLAANGKAQDADKLDGVDSSAFAGTGRTSYQGSTLLSGCTPQVLLSHTISPSRPALVYAIGTGVYNPNTSNQRAVRLSLELREVSSLTGSTVVAGGGVVDTDGNGGDIPVSIEGVLMSGSSANAVYSSSTPFEVTPGNSYVLRLIGEGNNGTCTGSPVMRSIALTYVLIGK